MTGFPRKRGPPRGGGGGRGRGPARPPPGLGAVQVCAPQARWGEDPPGRPSPWQRRAGSRGGGRRRKEGRRERPGPHGCLNRAEAQSRVSARPAQGTEGGPGGKYLENQRPQVREGPRPAAPAPPVRHPPHGGGRGTPGAPPHCCAPPPAQWPQGGSCPPGEPPLAPRPTRTGSAQAAPPPGKSRPSPFTPAAPHNVGDTFSSSRDPCPSSLTPTEAARLAQGDLGPMWRVQPGPGPNPGHPACSALGHRLFPRLLCGGVHGPATELDATPSALQPEGKARQNPTDWLFSPRTGYTRGSPRALGGREGPPRLKQGAKLGSGALEHGPWRWAWRGARQGDKVQNIS